MVRVFVNRQRGMIDVRNFVVEEADERAHEPAFGLTFLAEKEHVVAGEQGEVDFGNDGVVVADDAGKEVVAGLQHTQEVVANLFFTVLEIQPLARRSLRLVGRTPEDIKYSWWRNRMQRAVGGKGIAAPTFVIVGGSIYGTSRKRRLCEKVHEAPLDFLLPSRTIAPQDVTSSAFAAGRGPCISAIRAICVVI